MLLASDFVLDATAQGREGCKLTLSSDGTNLRLLDCIDGSLVKAQRIVDNSGTVTIIGSSQSETLTIDSSVPASLSVMELSSQSRSLLPSRH